MTETKGPVPDPVYRAASLVVFGKAGQVERDAVRAYTGVPDPLAAALLVIELASANGIVRKCVQ